MGSRPMPPCAPIVAANEAARPSASPRMAPDTWSRPSPPYSSATVAPTKPSSAPFCTSSRASFQSFFSSSGMRGRTSLSMNCRAVSVLIVEVLGREDLLGRPLFNQETPAHDDLLLFGYGRHKLILSSLQRGEDS